MYLDLGKTIAFDTHSGSMARFCRNQSSCPWDGHESKASAAAMVAGFDTVQYTRFDEYNMIKHEIVLTTLNTHTAQPDVQVYGQKCPPKRFEPLFSSGWNGAKV